MTTRFTLRIDECQHEEALLRALAAPTVDWQFMVWVVRTAFCENQKVGFALLETTLDQTELTARLLMNGAMVRVVAEGDHLDVLVREEQAKMTFEEREAFSGLLLEYAQRSERVANMRGRRYERDTPDILAKMRAMTERDEVLAKALKFVNGLLAARSADVD